MGRAGVWPGVSIHLEHGEVSEASTPVCSLSAPACLPSIKWGLEWSGAAGQAWEDMEHSRGMMEWEWFLVWKFQTRLNEKHQCF